MGSYTAFSQYVGSSKQCSAVRGPVNMLGLGAAAMLTSFRG